MTAKLLVRRTNMVAAVLESLSERIIVGDFGTDGALPPEGELASRYGVSRTVIREAMHSLRAQGLVEVAQGKPPRVKPPEAATAIASLDTLLRRNRGSLFDLIEARRPLEGEIAALAAERATPEQLEQLKRAIDEQKSAATLDAMIDADMRFHRILAEGAGNPIFGLLLETLAGLLRSSRQETLAQSGVEVALHGHRAILRALRAKDGAAARRAMLDHLRLAERDLKERKV
jgi:GntR family transcriptional regulator, transcriptional repressor for pyruvate dehydrogenase complex